MMATSIQFGSMVSVDKTWKEAVSRKWSCKPSLLSVRVPAGRLRPMGMTSSFREEDGLLEEHHLQEMPDVSARSEPDGVRGGRAVPEGESPERTEEEISTTGRRELLVASILVPSLSALTLTSIEGSGAAASAAEDTLMTTVMLYTNPLAFNPAKAKLALEEHGIKYTEKEIDIFGGESLEPWYLKINPNSSVPSLVAGDLTITESADIVRWADQQEKGPLGGDKVDKNFVAEWISKVDAWDGNLFLAAFGSLGSILEVSTEHKIKVTEAYAKRFPDLAEVYTKKSSSMKSAVEESTDKAKAEANQAQLVALLDEAESRLSKTKYLAGDEYSNADVVFTPVLYRIPMVNLDKEFLEPRGNLKKYWSELKTRPSYQKTFGVSDSGLSTASLILPAFGKIYFSKLTGQY